MATSTPSKRIGRKPIAPPAFSSLLPAEVPGPPPGNAAECIREHACDGWSMVGIAFRMGVNFRTFSRWLEENTELKDAFDLGREQERHTLHNVIYRRAVEKDDITAAIMLLNSRHNYRSDSGNTGNRVNVTIALPGAMTMAQFNALSVEKEPTDA